MDTQLNILVVEDHDDLREATVAAISAMGYTVQGGDCAEAMDEVLAHFRADVALLDLNLPGEDGLSIARRLRSAQPAIGIIMVTARTQANDFMQGYGSGADSMSPTPSRLKNCMPPSRRSHAASGRRSAPLRHWRSTRKPCRSPARRAQSICLITSINC
jgi:CheY-like chemotaxis protein